MPDRRLVLLGLSASALGACRPRAMIALAPPGAGIASRTQEVFVATTRAEAEVAFGPRRSQEVGFGRYLVSVPPEHAVGRIEIPPKREPWDPARHFVTAQEDRYRDAAEFRTSVARALRASGRGEAIIYVHGFNSTFAEGVYRIAQIGHDLRIPGVALHYSWPSAAEPLNYAYDRDSVLFARDGLEQMLTEVHAAGARHVTLVAHSMGALLVMETLRQMAIADPGRVRRLVQAVVLFAPDIDVELFRSQALRIGRLPPSFVIFTSRRDRALTLSARLTGQRARLGSLSDFSRLADLEVVLVDVSAFSDGTAINHFPTARSPSLLALFGRIQGIDAALSAEAAGRPGLIPGTVLTLQNATAIILSPITAALR